MSEPIRDAVLQGLQFIEANLRREIGVSDVAACASYSQFYFSREFARLTHCTVYDYILRRKLSEAYQELFNKRIKIVDLAFRYGFQSHEVFTRAYRKMFGENPSESSYYKPLSVFEPIGEAYLAFLSGLRVDTAEHAVDDCYFEVTGASETIETGGNTCLLVLLSPQNRYRCQCIFRGILHSKRGQTLTFALSGLEQVIRIYHTDTKFAFRYYTDHFHEADTMVSNYILLQSQDTYIDIILSTARK
ncbi:MAG: helix-turn-helix transcriptional regulator [Clostridiales bacterium]|nr:helix-turn-helix transcriptional regulator [Clostridiales bacterium]